MGKCLHGRIAVQQKYKICQLETYRTMPPVAIADGAASCHQVTGQLSVLTEPTGADRPKLYGCEYCKALKSSVSFSSRLEMAHLCTGEDRPWHSETGIARL